MKPEKTLEYLQELRAKLIEAKVKRRILSQTINELRAKIYEIIDKADDRQMDLTDRLPPKPKV